MNAGKKKFATLAVVCVALSGCMADVGSSEEELPKDLAEAIDASMEGEIFTLVAGEVQVVEEVRAVEKDGEYLQGGSGYFSGGPNDGYDIWVKTGDAADSGTSARVYGTLCSLGSGVWRCATYFFDNPNRNDWERGQKDDFHPRGIDLGGKIDYIYFEHDNSNNKPGWYLKYVDTRYRKNQAQTRCSVEQWLATTAYPNRTWTETYCQ